MFPLSGFMIVCCNFVVISNPWNYALMEKLLQNLHDMPNTKFRTKVSSLLSGCLELCVAAIATSPNNQVFEYRS